MRCRRRWRLHVAPVRTRAWKARQQMTSAANNTNERRRRGRLALAALGACCAYVCVVAYVPQFTTYSPFVCPTRRCLGLQCPSCGMTRALASLLHFDVASAVAYNPLVLFAAPLGLALGVDALLQSLGWEGLTGWMTGLHRWGWRFLVAAFVVVGLVRVATWLAPSWNPGGWLIPPAEFPRPSVGAELRGANSL